MKNFENTIKEIETDDCGRIIRLKGSCKASDLQKKPIINFYFDDDFCKEFGIKRLF